jgi:hypothetical protein
MSVASDRLPHVDEHATVIEADLDATWDALTRTVDRSFASAQTARGARVLGCADVAPAGPRPLEPGSAVPGFHVGTADRPHELALLGRHRFSDYALIFRLDDLDSGRTRLRAETRADFPGLKGRLYHAMVIGTRVHIVVTRRLLSAVKHRAERS